MNFSDGDYNADEALEMINKMFERSDVTPDMLRDKVADLESFLASHHAALAKVKRARTGTGKVNSEIQALRDEMAAVRDRIEEAKGASRGEVEELRKLADSLREPIAIQCERVRLYRSDPDPPKPLKLIKAIHEITRNREAEIEVAAKQLRELQMILAMMRQHETELEASSSKQITEQAREKDRKIYEAALSFMRERDQMLMELQSLEQDITAIRDHLHRGHYESSEQKQQKLRDYRAKVHRDYVEAQGVREVFDQRPSEENTSPRGVDKSVIVFERSDLRQPTGLRFEDKTLLTAVEPNSLGERLGFGRMVGRRVIMINGEEIRPGQAVRLAGKKNVELTFDMDAERLRCSFMKNDSDDPIKRFKVKESKFCDPYKDMERQTDDMKQKTRREREQLQTQRNLLQEYEAQVERERQEKEREIENLQKRLSSVRTRQTEYEGENQRLSSWMELNSKTLKQLQGKNRESERLLKNTQAEVRAITAPKEQPPAQPEPEKEEEPEAEEKEEDKQKEDANGAEEEKEEKEEETA